MIEVYATPRCAATERREGNVMPNRLIRDGLMESEKVLSVPVEARWLFMIVLLSADDMGLFEATEFKLARRADVRRELAGKLMQMLADVDLVRFYDAEGRRYGFIPRFRQRLQIKRSKHPLPPSALMRDDDDAIGKAAALTAARDTGELAGAFGKQWEELRLRVFERDGYRCVRCQSRDDLAAHHLTPKSKGGRHTLDNLTTLCGPCNSWARNNDANCNEIKDLTIKTASAQHLDSIDADAAQPSEPEPEPEETKKEPTVLVDTAVAAPTYRVPPCPNSELVALYHEHLPALPSVEVMNDSRKRALGARWREVCADGKFDKAQGLEWFGWFFGRVAKSDFLMGRLPGKSGRVWKATFDFLVKPEKFVRVVEGAYEGETR